MERGMKGVREGGSEGGRWEGGWEGMSEGGRWEGRRGRIIIIT